jgi:hypothetical protein
MKRINFVVILLLCSFSLFSQAVKDRSVIPVAVNLNQVLRMTITNGGNIEFVFNTIDDYKNGLSSEVASASANPTTSQSLYQTDFSVSSSTRWELTYGTEEADFLGTDHPTAKFDIDNVGFTITNNGSNSFEGAAALKGATAGASLWSVPTKNATEVSALQTYPIVLITDNGTVNANAGDAVDNSFTLNWRCGTAEAGAVVPMNDTKLIDQNPSPVADRYVVNVIFDVASI